MAEIKVTNLAKFYTLVSLWEHPHHGYEIIKEVGAKMGKTISPGQLYPFLASLEEKGYLKARETGERDKKVYALTPSGKGLVQDMLEKFGDIVHHAVEASLKKCAHCGCEVYRGGVEQQVKGRLLMFCCSSCAQAFG